MKLLLDTHTLLWFMAGDERLSSRVRNAVESKESTNFVSVATWWEIAIKISLGKLHLTDPLPRFMEQCADEGFRLLAIEPHHIAPLVGLPFHHRDPFDRLIIAQAVAEKMTVCSSDAHFSRYPVQTLS